MVIIPTFDIACFEQEVVLDGVPYLIRMDYNVKFAFWSLTVKSRDEVTLLAGQKLVLGYDLFAHHPDRGLPPGQLFVVDTSEKILKIDRDNLINDLALVYVPEAEL